MDGGIELVVTISDDHWSQYPVELVNVLDGEDSTYMIRSTYIMLSSISAR